MGKYQKESQEYSERIINTVREPLIVLDQDLRVVTASRSFYDYFKVNPEETVAHKLGMDNAVNEIILYATPMHDVVKIGIPDDILFKEGKLDPFEWEIRK